MRSVLISVASASEVWFEAAVLQYQNKISHFLPLELKRLKPKKMNRDSSLVKKIAESNQILDELVPGDYVVLFDRLGAEFDSIKFSKKIENILNQSKKRIVFIVGGSYGVTDDLKKRADLCVSLSKMTMNHLVAEIAILEQIYRSFMINKNIPYHNSY